MKKLIILALGAALSACATTPEQTITNNAANRAWWAQYQQQMLQGHSLGSTLPMPNYLPGPMRLPQAGPYGQPNNVVWCRNLNAYATVCY